MSKMREPEAVKLFIGQIPKDYKEADLRSIFEVFGEIHSLNLLHDKATGQHKGCAFLTYYDNASSKKAQEDLHQKRTLPGARNPMQVKPAASETSEENRKLFVGMLSKDLNDDGLKSMFSSFGTIENITILRDPQGKSKGCAFIKFETRLQAANAIKALHNSQTMPGCSKPIVVKLADTEKDKASKRLGQGQSSNVGGVGGVSNVGGAIPNVAAADLTAQLLQQQTAYYQQLLAQVALPQILQANPGLAALAGTAALPAATAQSNLMKPSSYGLQNNNQGAIGSLPLANSGYPGVQQYITTLPAQTTSAFFQGSSGLPSADSKREGPPGSNLFIYQIPTEYTDADLIQTFQPFGNILSAKVFIDKNTQMSKGFGFVSYDNPNSAAAAINSMNGFVIGNKRLKVQLKKGKDQGKPY